MLKLESVEIKVFMSQSVGVNVLKLQKVKANAVLQWVCCCASVAVSVEIKVLESKC